MAYLVLVRHGESLWNQKDLWTGLTDIELSEKGKEEAKKAGILLKGIHFDHVFTSPLKRALETYEIIKKELNLNVLKSSDSALNERDYGDFTGKNKWEVKKEVGDEEFFKIRRGFNHPIPNGESLKQVYERVVPYYKEKVEPELEQGKNVLIVAHGNSLRALIKYLENISDEDISKLELATGEIYVYSIDNNGKITSKEIRK